MVGPGAEGSQLISNYQFDRVLGRGGFGGDGGNADGDATPELAVASATAAAAVETATPTPTATARPTPRRTLSPTTTRSPVVTPTSESPVVFFNSFRGVAYRANKWSYPDELRDAPAIVSLDWSYVPPPGADVYFSLMQIDLDVDAVAVDDILALYPDADLVSGGPALTPGVYPFFFEGAVNLIADGEVHKITSRGILPGSSALNDSQGESFPWAPFVEEPYLVTDTPTLVPGFRNGGQNWFSESTGFCGPDSDPG